MPGQFHSRRPYQLYDSSLESEVLRFSKPLTVIQLPPCLPTIEPVSHVYKSNGDIVIHGFQEDGDDLPRGPLINTKSIQGFLERSLIPRFP